MYNGIQKIEKVIDEIEARLTSEMDYGAMAAQMALSVYEFRRIFAFVVGCPLSEYIRKRRLSLAACELAACKRASVRQISEKYGYSTVASFSKAFSEYHGFPPSSCQRQECDIKVFPKAKFQLTVSSEEEHSFRIVADSAFLIRGYSAVSDHTDTCCCEQVWTDYYGLGRDKELTGERIFVSYSNEQGRVRCTIGERISPSENGSKEQTVGECSWLTVKMNTVDDDAVNRKYGWIMNELLPSTGFSRREGIPTVEVFPRDMSGDNFEWEIRIPIE